MTRKIRNTLDDYYHRHPESLVSRRDGTLGLEIGPSYVLNTIKNLRIEVGILEYGFLRFFLDRQKIIHNRVAIRRHLHGTEIGPDSTIDSYLAKGRQILGKAQIASCKISTVSKVGRDVGYVLHKAGIPTTDLAQLPTSVPHFESLHSTLDEYRSSLVSDRL